MRAATQIILDFEKGSTEYKKMKIDFLAIAEKLECGSTKFLSLNFPLRRRNSFRVARVNRDCLAQRPRKSFENSFNLVVRRTGIFCFEINIRARAVRENLRKNLRSHSFSIRRPLFRGILF